MPEPFRQHLKDMGISETRVEDLDQGFAILHKALDSLDYQNKKVISNAGGLLGLLHDFAHLEGYVNVVKDLYPLEIKES